MAISVFVGAAAHSWPPGAGPRRRPPGDAGREACGEPISGLDLLWGRCRHTRGPPGAGPRRQPAAPGPAAGRRTTRAGRSPPSAVTGYREGPSHTLPGHKFGSGVDHGPTVFRREGRFVPGMDSYQPFFAVGQNLAPGTLRRGSGGGGRAGSRHPRRGLEECGVPGRLAISVFFGAAVGTLVDRPVRALAAGRRAVRACRVSLP